jgi:O-antigen ligase
MASVAVFEMFKGWLLFSKIGELWGIQHVYGTQYGFYFVRFGFLRAQASAGHASSLGYLLAIAFGFWLSLKSQVKSARLRFAVPTLFWLGLLASQARGPILGAVAIYIVFSILGPRAAPRLIKAVSVLAILVGALSFTAFGERIMNSIPFFGQRTDDASVNYRQRLAERSWELIQLHPFLGDPLVLTKMEDLRQGEGIIDLVNTYAGVTLFYGSIGLLAFLAPIVLGLFEVYRVRKEIARRDPDYASLGVSLAACIIGTFFIISSNSPIYGYEKMFYILAGLAAAYTFAGTLSERR